MPLEIKYSLIHSNLRISNFRNIGIAILFCGSDAWRDSLSCDIRAGIRCSPSSLSLVIMVTDSKYGFLKHVKNLNYTVVRLHARQLTENIKKNIGERSTDPLYLWLGIMWLKLLLKTWQNVIYYRPHSKHNARRKFSCISLKKYEEHVK